MLPTPKTVYQQTERACYASVLVQNSTFTCRLGMTYEMDRVWNITSSGLHEIRF